MVPSSEIYVELREISPKLADFPVINPYVVPAGYFDQLAEMILSRVRSESASSPEEELKAISPFLAGLNKSTPYKVPDGYFREIQVPIPGKESQQRQAKVISLQPRKVFRYAVAAVMAGLIATGAWFFLGERDISSAQQLAVNTDSAAEMHVQQNIGKISENEIADFIDAGSLDYPLDNTIESGELADTDVQFMLADVSDEELEQYLMMNNPEREKFN